MSDEDAITRDQRFSREVAAQISLGLDAEAFLRSKLGEHLTERAISSAMSAMDELKTVDPDDTKRVRALQNEIYRAESVQCWIAEAIEAGRRAEIDLQQESQ